MVSPGSSAASDAFDAGGIVHLPGVVPADEVRAMRDCVWDALRELGGLVDLHGALRPRPGTEHEMAEVVQGPVFDGLEPRLAGALDQVFGAAGWVPATGVWRGVALPNLPGAGGRWTVPDTHWHVDEPASWGRVQARSMAAFVFLDRVVAGGGTTVVMTGSPRRLRALAADLAPDRPLTLEESTLGLARVEPWVHELLAPGVDADARRRRLLIDGCVSASIPLRIAELTGEPGDVTLMDLRCLHAPSANTSGLARIVVKMACINTRS